MLMLEESLVVYAKVMVKLLGSVKDHRLFWDLLEDYEPAFCEHLLTVYLGAYDEFCWAYKVAYGCLYLLS